MVLHSLLEMVRDYTCRKWGINNKRDQRNKVIKALFRDVSRDRIKHAAFRDFKMSSRISSSVTGSN